MCVALPIVGDRRYGMDHDPFPGLYPLEEL